MCEFVSWCIHKGTVYFMDDEKLASRRGKELQAFDPNPDNWRGHGSICWFYDFEGSQCVQKECTDFSSPENFPPQISEAIKVCKFAVLGVPESPEQLLNPSALAEYLKIGDAAWAECEKISDAAWAEYEKIVGPALVAYRKIQGPAWAEYEKIVGPARAEYEKIVGPARAEYEKIVAPAWAEYEKTQDAARAEYEKTVAKAFWTLFANPENRTEGWK